MRLQTKAQDHRSAQSPSRTAVQAPLDRLRRRQACRPLPARRQGRRRAEGSGQNPLRPELGRRSGRPERSTPLIPLTLRGMHRSRRLRRSSARPSFVLLSMLALLALASFPVLARASSEIPEYETEVPTAEGHKVVPTQGGSVGGGGTQGGGRGTTASNSSSPGGASQNSSGSTQTSGSGSSSGNPSSASNNSSTGSDSGQGSPGKGATASKASGSIGSGKAVTTPSTAEESSSSSPLVPILIAIAVLATLSIGAVLIRQRRQRRGDSSGQVSPKAS